MELLAVADDGADRIAVFRSAKGEPDDRWIIRFRQNEDGNYEAYLSPRRMYGPHPVRGVYTEPLRGYSGDREVCYAIWNESEELAEIFRREGCPSAQAFEDTEAAFRAALSLKGEDGMLFCVGSLYLVGEIKELLRKEDAND